MSVSKEVIKQCLISKQREVDEAEIVPRPVSFEENGNYVIREQQEESPLVTIVKGIIMLGALAYAYVVFGGMIL